MSQNPVDLALSFLGVPYLWGGSSPAGFDCSGLVQYVYAQAGIKLPRTSESQIGVGTPIPVGPPGNELANALPGDLVFFNNASHEGLVYDPARNKMIDAPHTGAFVRIDSASGFGSITGIRRVSDLPMGTGALAGGGGGRVLGGSIGPTSQTATLTSADNPCAVTIPLLGCLLSKSQFRSFGGGVIIIGGVAIAALGIWLVVGHPGSKEAGMAAKLAVLA